MATALGRPPAAAAGNHAAEAERPVVGQFQSAPRTWPDRVERLRQRAYSLGDSQPRGERLRLVTESYRQTEGQPAVLRRARALAHILAHNTIHLYPEDRIAGLPQRHVYKSQAIFQAVKPELAGRHDFPEFAGGRFADVDDLDEEQRALLAYWHQQPSMRAAMATQLTDETKRAIQYGVFSANGFIVGHCIPGFERTLALGLEGIAAAAATRRQSLQGQPQPANPNEGATFLEAVEIASRAVTAWAGRYGALARAQGTTETDPVRRAELDQLAATCEWVPANPPRTFHEALQSIWLVHRAVDMEFGDASALAISFGRLDQYLWPYYAADRDAGRLTPGQARELIEEFYVKCYRVYADQQIMVGGLTQDGTDGTNDLSYMFLDVAAQHRLLIDLGARVHRGTPDAFLRKCAEVTQYNLGFSIFGDNATIAALVRAGIPERDAHRYSIVGCVEVVIPDVAAPRTMEHQFNLAKCLELALNDGKCRLSGVQVGPQTGDPRAFTRYAHVLDAYHAQVAHFERLACEATNVGHRVQQNFTPVPFLSGTMQGCVESAKDLTAGGARLNPSGGCVPGLANVPDSLAAIKKVVFEDRRADMATLVDALDANFQGYDALRAALLRAPKFGNADPSVDRIAREEQLFDYDHVMRYTTEHGGPFLRLHFTGSDGVTFQWGPRTGALPDGRLARTPIAISVSPSQGMDVRGPFAAIKSVASLDHTAIPGGTSWIMELNSKHVRAANGSIDVEKIAELLRYAVDQGVANYAINVLDPEPLRTAMQHPEALPSLSARLYGYSEYIVNLDPRLQDFLLSRTDREPHERRLAEAGMLPEPWPPR